VTRIGVLTGGGDCAGLDAIIRAVVRRGDSEYGDELIGVRNGWLGLLEDDTVELTVERTAGILTRGGTFLCTSRTDPLGAGGDGVATIRRTMQRHGIEALVVIGGDGTLGGARDASLEGIPLVGVPKTIDNDVGGTDVSVGFHTAVQVATDAIDRLYTTAESHHRVMVIEVMGRHAGWIATHAGLAGGADAILIPEHRFDLDELCDQLRQRKARGSSFSIVVVAEGARPDGWVYPQEEPLPGNHTTLVPSGIGIMLQQEIVARTGFDARATILGHVLRGGTPSAYDRIIATRFGIAAVDAIHDGRFGTMTALRGARVVQVDLVEVLNARNPLDPELYAAAAVFFG